ncbi:hypothetical protein QTH47_12890 [Clostridium perfringens]|nr:hypothetical protein [Clostridium perfringens]
MKYKEKVINRIIRHCMVYYEPIDKKNMKMGEMPYNRRCHLNAVQNVKEGKAKSVHLCVCIDGNDVIVHFINRDKEGYFVDNTLGWGYKNLDYYRIRRIDPIEYDDISKILDSTKEELVFEHSNSIMRKLTNIDFNNFI